MSLSGTSKIEEIGKALAFPCLGAASRPSKAERFRQDTGEDRMWIDDGWSIHPSALHIRPRTEPRGPHPNTPRSYSPCLVPWSTPLGSMAERRGWGVEKDRSQGAPHTGATPALRR